MDIENMHIAVKLELDKSSALELPAFEIEEIDFWLNNAIRKFVKTRYSGLNAKKQGFEQTQKRTDDLRTLINHYTDSNVAVSDYTNGYQFDLPADYWFALSEECLVVKSGGGGRSGITECTIDEYRQRIDDPFSEHLIHYNNAKPLRIFNDVYVELIGDGVYTISTYYLTYLVAPAVVDNVPEGTTDCDLPEHTHDEIVKLAVSMMLENIEQPRYQTYQNEVHSIE